MRLLLILLFTLACSWTLPALGYDPDEEENDEQAAEPQTSVEDIFNGLGNLLGGGEQDSPTDDEAASPAPATTNDSVAEVVADPESDPWAFIDGDEQHDDASQAYSSIREQFVQHALNGNYGQAASLLLEKSADYRDVQAEDVYLVCETWLHVRNFGKLDNCINAFETQLNAQNATEISAGTNFSARWNRYMGEFYINRWRATRALELADYTGAIHFGEAARLITDNGKIDLASDSLLGILSAPGNFLNDMVPKDHKGHYINSAIGYDIYGILAIAYAQTGNQAGYDKNLSDLLRLVNSRDAVEYKTRYWIVLAHLAGKDYETALRESALREKDLLDGFNDAITSEYNPILGLVGAVLGTGKLSYYKTYGILEYQYIKAHSLYKLKRRSEAKAIFDSLLHEQGIEDAGAIYFRILSDRAEIAEQEKDTATAFDLYTKAVDVIEQQRSTIATESGKLGFAGNQQRVYEKLIRLLLEQSRYDEAFNYVERAKARALVDMLASRNNFSGGAATAKAADYIRNLNQIEQQSQLAVQSPGTTTRLRSSSSALRSQLKNEYPELASLVTVDTDSVSGIRSRLAANDVLLEYYQQGDKLYAFVLDNKGVTAFTLDGRGLAKDVGRFRDAIREASPRHRVLGKQLYERLIRPLASRLGNSNLVIVPHGPLHYLPFNALHDGKHYLVDQHSLRSLPSASVLRFLRQRRQPGQMLVLGNPDLGDASLDLPGAESEARKLATIWRNSDVLLRKNASETAIRRNGQAYSHLHFASHGRFEPGSPLDSRLLLAGDSSNDGNLTVGEMYELKLNADMVTLSACQTGVGKISSGDDVVGLTRGFLYAGASSIVASLWEVADEPTAYLMVQFYKNLAAANKAEALRQAQLATRKKFAHPLYWAAFQLTGAR